MQASGLSRRELADAVENKLIERGICKDPVVNVQIKGFKVSVMGEVNGPGVQTMSGDRITASQALTVSDLTPSGKTG